MVFEEYLVSLGLDVGLEKFKDKADEDKLRAALQSFITGRKDYYDVCRIADEIDYQGLYDYMTGELKDFVTQRMFSPSKMERGKAREDILSAAVSYANADTDEARRRVMQTVSAAIDIIHSFYAKRVDRKEWLLSSEIVDAVDEAVSGKISASTQVMTDKIEETKNEILKKMDGSLFSIDKATELAENGRIGDVEGGIKKILEHVSLTHPLYPDFGYGYFDGNLRSKALTENAKKNFPVRYSFKGTIKFGNEFYNEQQGDPIDYSYRHQKPFSMEISDAVKYLGDIKAPDQAEVDRLKGKVVVGSPPEFPQAFACSIKVGDMVFYDYVLLRVQEILDDGTYIIGNKEQGGEFYFEIRVNPNNSLKPDFKTKMNNPSIRGLLNQARFMKALREEKDLHIFVLKEQQDFMAGSINDVDYPIGFSSLEEEIDFLERLCDIEDYFHVTFHLNGNIYQQEYNTVLRISDLVRGNDVYGTWTDAAFTGIIDQHFRDELLNIEDEEHEFSYTGESEMELFGEAISFRFMRSFIRARIVELDKVKKKVDILDDGDSIKIKLKAGNDDTAIETLNIPEKMIEDISLVND